MVQRDHRWPRLRVTETGGPSGPHQRSTPPTPGRSFVGPEADPLSGAAPGLLLGLALTPPIALGQTVSGSLRNVLKMTMERGPGNPMRLQGSGESVSWKTMPGGSAPKLPQDGRVRGFLAGRQVSVGSARVGIVAETRAGMAAQSRTGACRPAPLRGDNASCTRVDLSGS